jgi:hypothetical protein
MRVEEDFICEHGMPKPWATCTDCMYRPDATRPTPPRKVEEKKPAKPSRAPSKSKLPLTAKDPLPPLTGNKDLSFPVFSIEAHVEGPGNDWLIGELGFPTQLRAGGWVYLRHDGRLGARARVTGIGFREDRPQHTGDTAVNWGPGPTIEIDPSTWEPFDHDLEELAESQRQGYRYLATATDGSIKHLMANDPIPDDFEIDPPQG